MKHRKSCCKHEALTLGTVGMLGCHLLFAKRTEAKVGIPSLALELGRCGMVGDQEGTALTMVRQRKVAVAA